VPLRAPHDFVSLSRRTRVAGEEFGLTARDVRRLSTASYEAARLLTALTPAPLSAEAEVRLGDDHALQVLFRLPLPADLQRAAFRARVERELAGLEPLVYRLTVEETPDGVTVCLLSLRPPGSVAALQRRAAESVPFGAPEREVPDGALRDQFKALEREYRDLQSELHDTNRGVIAVYAELEDQAHQLRQAEDRLRLLLDSVDDYAICMLSPDGEVASWNAGGERIFRCRADDVTGRSFARFYTPADRELQLPAAHLREARERGRHEGEGLRVRHGGSTFDAHVVLTAVGRNGDLRGYALVVRDITERKRLEDDLRRRAEDLAVANRAKEDFLATLSHELRTPLNAMLGWTRLLRMGKLDAAAGARALETIERNARVQEQLIADILDVSRIVTGKLRVELAPVELVPIVDAAIDAVRPAADAKNLRLTLEAPSPRAILGDADRLQQVLWNLLVNAIKFTPPGGQVSVALHGSGSEAVLTVADSGEGIGADLLPFIFDRFRQGDSSVTRPHGGLGLGLSIVRHIVELHGGRVEARSDGPGKGSTFVLHLPVRAIQEMDQEAAWPASRSSR
jgi:PAS domain S-box-containing protein